MTQAKDVLAGLQAKLQGSPRLQGWNGVFQFQVSGEGGGTFTVAVQGGQLRLTEGVEGSPNCTVSLGAADLAELVAGRLNPMAAFMPGKLKVQGDMALAMRLQGLLG